MNNELVAVGLVLLVIGIIGGVFFCLGGIVAVVGLVLLIVGLAEEEKPVPARGYYGAPSPAYPVGAPPPYPTYAQVIPCPSCGAGLPYASRFCSACGKPLEQPQVPHCEKCGTVNQIGARFCRQCGAILWAPRQGVKKLSYTDLPENVLIACQNCGQNNVRTDRYCRNCDADLSEAKKALAERLTGAKFE